MFDTIGHPVPNLYISIRNKIQDISQSITLRLGDEKQKNSIFVLDGLRGFACFVVIFFHLNLLARDYHIWRPIIDLGSVVGAIALFGQSGVMLFFILSGFLLFLPYTKSLLFDQKWPSLLQFYLRRGFRIIPAYYVALFLLLLFLHPEYLHRIHWHEVWLFITFRMDFPITYQQINGPFWTMAVETQFYIILPFIAWTMSLLVRRGKLLWRISSLTFCILVVIAWGLLTRYWGLKIAATSQLDAFIPHSFSDALGPYIYGSNGKYLEVFALGMLLSIAYVCAQNSSIDGQWNTVARRLSVVAFLLGGAILFFMALWHFYMWYYNYTLHFFDHYREILVHSWDQWEALCYGIGYSLCMFGFLFGPKLLKRPLELAPMRWLGLTSYSLYIWHFPLMMIYVQLVLPQLQSNGWQHIPQYIDFWLWILVVVVPISVLSYLWIEKPFIRLGELLRQKLVKTPKQPKQPAVDSIEMTTQSVLASANSN